MKIKPFDIALGIVIVMSLAFILHKFVTQDSAPESSGAAGGLTSKVILENRSVQAPKLYTGLTAFVEDFLAGLPALGRSELMSLISKADVAPFVVDQSPACSLAQAPRETSFVLVDNSLSAAYENGSKNIAVEVAPRRCFSAGQQLQLYNYGFLPEEPLIRPSHQVKIEKLISFPAGRPPASLLKALNLENATWLDFAVSRGRGEKTMMTIMVFSEPRPVSTSSAKSPKGFILYPAIDGKLLKLMSADNKKLHVIDVRSSERQQQRPIAHDSVSIIKVEPKQGNRKFNWALTVRDVQLAWSVDSAALSRVIQLAMSEPTLQFVIVGDNEEDSAPFVLMSQLYQLELRNVFWLGRGDDDLSLVRQ